MLSTWALTSGPSLPPTSGGALGKHKQSVPWFPHLSNGYSGNRPLVRLG